MTNKFYEKLLQIKYDTGLCQEVDCTEEENRTYLAMTEQKKELPFGILRREDTNGSKLDKFYRVVPFDISHEELEEYCSLKQTKYLHTIKNCAVFFTVLAVISLVATIILFIRS